MRVRGRRTHQAAEYVTAKSQEWEAATAMDLTRVVRDPSGATFEVTAETVLLDALGRDGSRFWRRLAANLGANTPEGGAWVVKVFPGRAPTTGQDTRKPVVAYDVLHFAAARRDVELLAQLITERGLPSTQD